MVVSPLEVQRPVNGGEAAGLDTNSFSKNSRNQIIIHIIDIIIHNIICSYSDNYISERELKDSIELPGFMMLFLVVKVASRRCT